MSVESQGRSLRELRRKAGQLTGGRETLKTILLRIQEEEKQAVGPLVAFALELAGTAHLPLRVPEPTPRAPAIAAPAPPSPPPAPPPVKKPRWTMDIRPGPHDLLTWEEAMEVPWYNPFHEPER